MYKQLFKTITSILLVLHAFTGVAQNDSNVVKLSKFVKNINALNSVFPQEKVYLHFDNTGYYLGEKIWFKAYVVNPTQNRPTSVSKVLYVELLNQQGYVLQTKKLKIENGQCHGDFQLTDSMFAGFYEVRAYTRYMLNFDQKDRWAGSTLIPDIMYGWGGFANTRLSSWGYYWEPFNGDNPSMSDFHKTNKYPHYQSDMLFSRVLPVYNQPALAGDYEEKYMLSRNWNPSRTINDLKLFIEFNNSRKRPLRLPKLVTEHPAPSPVNLSFYPEGGNLVKGLATKVAFKATDGEGMELELSGYVVDRNQKELTTFKTNQRGMGTFMFNPSDTGGYKAHVYYKNELYSFNLPSCLESGYTMSINNLLTNGMVEIEVQNHHADSTELLGLSAQCGGKVSWFDTIRAKETKPTILRISTKGLSTGVNQITLFNDNGQVYADRLVFINHEDFNHIKLKASTTKSTYMPFEAIGIDFQLTDANNKPIQTDFSLAVCDKATKEPSYNTDNIKTNLLLSSELKGYVADPTYFLESNDLNHRKVLDHLMLTQGWRRYSWKKMAGVEIFKMVEPAEKGLIIDGVISFKEEKNTYDELNDMWSSHYECNPAANVRVSLNIAHSDSMLITGEQVVDKNGLFRFEFPDIVGQHRAILEMQDIVDTVKSIKKPSLLSKVLSFIFVPEEGFEPGFMASINRFPVLPKPTFTFYELNSPLNNTLDVENQTTTGSLKSGVNLKSVVVKGKRKNRYKDPDLSQPDFVISGDKILEIVSDRYIVSEMRFIPLLDEVIHKEFRCITTDEDLFLDGLFGTNRLFKGFPNSKGEIPGEIIGNVANIPFVNVESVGFYLSKGPRRPFQSAFQSAYILIRRKNTATRLNEQNMRRTLIEGYSEMSDFYHPDYSKSVPTSTKDFRRTLYWNPNVQTDSTGKASVRFYNNASCKTVSISAEGIATDGQTFVYR